MYWYVARSTPIAKARPPAPSAWGKHIAPSECPLQPGCTVAGPICGKRTLQHAASVLAMSHWNTHAVETGLGVKMQATHCLTLSVGLLLQDGYLDVMMQGCHKNPLLDAFDSWNFHLLVPWWYTPLSSQLLWPLLVGWEASKMARKPWLKLPWRF